MWECFGLKNPDTIRFRLQVFFFMRYNSSEKKKKVFFFPLRKDKFLLEKKNLNIAVCDDFAINKKAVEEKYM